MDDASRSLRNEPSAVLEDDSHDKTAAAEQRASRNEPKDVGGVLQRRIDDVGDSPRNEPTVISKAVALAPCTRRCCNGDTRHKPAVFAASGPPCSDFGSRPST
jgi:hypothetical protein